MVELWCLQVNGQVTISYPALAEATVISLLKCKYTIPSLIGKGLLCTLSEGSRKPLTFFLHFNEGE
jgi:hypothetical protein